MNSPAMLRPSVSHIGPSYDVSVQPAVRIGTCGSKCNCSCSDAFLEPRLWLLSKALVNLTAEYDFVNNAEFEDLLPLADRELNIIDQARFCLTLIYDSQPPCFQQQDHNKKLWKTRPG